MHVKSCLVILHFAKTSNLNITFFEVSYITYMNVQRGPSLFSNLSAGIYSSIVGSFHKRTFQKLAFSFEKSCHELDLGHAWSHVCQNRIEWRFRVATLLVISTGYSQKA